MYRELVALRAVDKKKQRIFWRGLLPPSLSKRDMQLLTAQHYNLRQETYPISFSPLASKMVKLFLGVSLKDLSENEHQPKKSKKKASTKQEMKAEENRVSRQFEITVFRYSSNLHSFPWIDWYGSTYLYFPTVFTRLKNMIGNEELKKQVEAQFRQQSTSAL